jgi:hypothetical protein
MATPRRPAAGFWITVALVAVLVGYPLSFGPACWIVSRMPEDPECFRHFYLPIAWLQWTDRPIIGNAVGWYGELLMSPEREVIVYATSDGGGQIGLRRNR